MRLLDIFLASAAVLVPGYAAAAVDNANAHVLQCTLLSGEKCVGSACAPIDNMQKIKLPLKLGVEFASGVIAATDVDGWPMVSRIASINREPSQIVLQGVGFGVGWTMAIKETGPDMTATLAAADGVAVFFGTCAPEPD